MRVPESSHSNPALTPAVAAAVQDLLTCGWTVLANTVSDRLRRKVREGNGHVSYHHVRQLFDGLPDRIAAQLIGRCVFAGLSRPPANWTRGRPDIVSSGAPRDFIPGLDLCAPIEEAPILIQVVSGSARLRDSEVWAPSQAQTISVAPGELLLLDARAVRRVADEALSCIWFGVVREWISPVSLWPTDEMNTMPPRAAAFFGRHMVSSTSVIDWLARTHGQRP